MENDIVKIKIDRIEENSAIAFSDNGRKFLFTSDGTEVRENDICNAVIDSDGKIISINVAKEETFTKKQGLKERLKKLFSK